MYTLRLASTGPVAAALAGLMVALGSAPALGQAPPSGSGGGAPSAVGTPAPRVAPVAPLSPPPTAPGSTSRTPQGTPPPPSSSSDGTTATSPLASPPVDPTPPAGGGSSRTDERLGTGTLPRTTSPSGGGEAEPSQPGGGGKSLADCMGFWDRGTHMTKQEWRAACQRTLNRLNNLKVELGDAMNDDTSKAENGGAKTRARRR